MEKFRRIFVVVMDSLGVGEAEDAAQFGDVGSNTLGHISQSVETFKIPHLRKLGMANLTPLKQVEPEEQPLGYYGKLREKSLGKDTMTGHWEMMGLEVKTPFKTFTETGFPPELIKELEERTGHKVIGNKRLQRNGNPGRAGRGGDCHRPYDRVYLCRLCAADLRQ